MNIVDATYLFSRGPREKSFNDEDNSDREDVLAALFSPDARIRESFTGHAEYGKFWTNLTSKFDESLRAFFGADSGADTSRFISHLTKKASRNHNYDFLAKTTLNDDHSGIKLEFKRGTSIYDQPQFLQIYAKPGNVVSPQHPSYAEYFYDKFGSKLASISGASLPDKGAYLSKVFGTTSGNSTFFQKAYGACKSGRRNDLLQLQYESIDEYLRVTSSKSHPFDTSAFQERLLDQLEKVFVSWDTSKQEFVIEQFTKASVTLTGEVRLLVGRNGFNSVSFSNEAGSSIDALLRWKNNPCVLGPAWQISLRAQ